MVLTRSSMSSTAMFDNEGQPDAEPSTGITLENLFSKIVEIRNCIASNQSIPHSQMRKNYDSLKLEVDSIKSEIL